MKYLLLLLFCSYNFYALAQSKSAPETVIHEFFQAMADVDTAYLNSVFLPSAVLMSSETKVDGASVMSGSIDKFIASVGASAIGDLDEQISNLRTEIDQGLATVWMDYSFYYKGALHHCGVNTFTLMQVEEGWKIGSLADTRRKDNCTSDLARQEINTLMDDWHDAASRADSTAYFDAMTIDAVYVGTDQSEVWSKRAFLKFAAPYFAKGKAWKFDVVDRNVYSADYAEIAWFDEVLDTWMGPCRGSGVVVKQDDQWKIKHYILSVAVANDDIQAYIKNLKSKEK